MLYLHIVMCIGSYIINSSKSRIYLPISIYLMKVFFSCSTGDLLNHSNDYLTIVNTIKQNGHTITRDWIDRAIEQFKNGQIRGKRSDLYSKVMSAISQSDAIVFDCTVRSMGIGHQLTYALDKSKPTLLLFRDSSHSGEDLFISGSKSSFLTIKRYKTNEDIQESVSNFLLKNLSKPKVRFQLVLDKDQNDFIEWTSYTYKRNKSEIIKSAIDKLAYDDKNYVKVP